ncbi:hypothetical protein BDW02DRAFT_412151 [Decorospora gaudefroyi]|uniref:Uncharacterized protein n=1 Tax=Decorospora gaudefroyi TaxID=184978 RepID=A0A6A5KTY6_9PLEO|nr:hypothetical protein BDW02DRAFT_412151 [Decorospora gaudefroyi]
MFVVIACLGPMERHGGVGDRFVYPIHLDCTFLPILPSLMIFLSSLVSMLLSVKSYGLHSVTVALGPPSRVTWKQCLLLPMMLALLSCTHESGQPAITPIVSPSKKHIPVWLFFSPPSNRAVLLPSQKFTVT